MATVATHTENEGESALVEIDAFDRLGASEAGDLVRPSCASARWVAQLVSGRPYRSMRCLLATSDDLVSDLAWADIAEALAAHPRIGERVAGAGTEARWSRAEQRDTADSAVAAHLLAGNCEYEQRFGHVFLICATGRSPEQMLAALRQRLGNPTDAERAVVRDELRAIVRLRLIKTFR